MKKSLKIIGIVLLALVLLIGLVLLVFKLVDRIRYRAFYSTAEAAFAMPGVRDGFVQQGFDYIPEKNVFLATGYMNDGSASRVYVIRADGSTTYTALKRADGRDYTGHTGGIAHFGDDLYITGSDGLDVFSCTDVLAGEPTTACKGTVLTYNDPAYCYIYNGHILVGSFYRPGNYETPAYEHITTPAGETHRSIMTVFRLDTGAENGIFPVPLAVISTPDQVQGMCITEEGHVVLSTSYGMAPSKLLVYDRVRVVSASLAFAGITEDGVPFDFATLPVYYLDGSCLAREIVAPPMAEELVYLDGKIHIMNESASDKYIFGKITTGRKVYAYPYTP